MRAVLAKAEDAEPGSNLALLGDKRFLFSPSGESFLMFGVRGRSWISLGAPVGRRDERMDLLWRFRELADAHAARPGFYGLDADDLPDVVELGFAIAKVGESAAVALDTFTIEGTKRGNLRRAWRQAGEAGATFEVVPPERVHEIMPQLQAISDAWLVHHAGGDKSFSMGGFYPSYVAEFPVGIVRFEGKIIAFATLWTTACDGLAEVGAACTTGVQAEAIRKGSRARVRRLGWVMRSVSVNRALGECRSCEAQVPRPCRDSECRSVAERFPPCAEPTLKRLAHVKKTASI